MFTKHHTVRLHLEALPTCLGIMVALAIALALALTAPYAGAAHAASLAATSNAQDTQDAQYQAAEGYKLYVGGRQVTSVNAGDVLGDGHVSYNAKTQTLTLDNANIKEGRMSGNNVLESISYSMSGTLTIKLVGKNKIAAPKTSSVPNYAFGIADWTSNNAKLKITGNGSLTVRAAGATYNSQAISTWKGMTVQGKAKLRCYGGSSTQKSTGIEVMGKFIVKGSAKVVAYGETGAFTKAPKFKSYTPKTKAGYSSKDIRVDKKKPSKGTYTKYPYVSIKKAAGKSKVKKPAKEKITSITSQPYGFSVIYKKITKNCKGYQVQCSTSKKFKKSYGAVHTDTTYNNAYYGYKRNDLASYTKYYVRVRALNKVGSKKVYGAWSPVKSVVTG